MNGNLLYFFQREKLVLGVIGNLPADKQDAKQSHDGLSKW